MSRLTLIIAACAIAVLSIAGIGYALEYTATNISSDNTVSYGGNTVTIVDSDENELGQSLTIAGPTYNEPSEGQVDVSQSTVWINSYKLKIETSTENASVYLRCWIHLKDVRSWAFIDDVSVAIKDGSTTYNLSLMTAGTDSTPTSSSVASSYVSLGAGVYDFEFSIRFSEVTLDVLPGDDLSFLDLSGSKLTFIVGKEDPLTSS